MLRQITRAALGVTLSDYLRLREDIINYRLSPSELNALLYRLAIEFHGDVSPDSMNDFSRVKVGNREFVICPMSKDSEREQNESMLPNIWELLRRYQRDYPEAKGTLLIPMRLCRGYMKIPTMVDIVKRKHAVLVEINLEDKRIQVHDSQNTVRWACYPDKLQEKSVKQQSGADAGFIYQPQVDYHTYAMQDDDYSCGYYVYHYVRSILQRGNSSDCASIKLAIASQYKNKETFLQAHGASFAVQTESDSEELREEPDGSIMSDWVEVDDKASESNRSTSTLQVLSVFTTTRRDVTTEPVLSDSTIFKLQQ